MGFALGSNLPKTFHTVFSKLHHFVKENIICVAQKLSKLLRD
jgi:hypothetical protein